jgi:very-short-patch-repair endonuclease
VRLGELLERQAGVLSRQQAVAAGLGPTVIDNRLRSGRWQRLQQGVYATFSGTMSREAVLWAALLRAGPAAALSHRTAAELHGLTSEQSSLIHITLPMTQRIAPIRGVVLHHSRPFARDMHPTGSPPRTSVEDTALDLTQVSATFEDAFGWLCRAVGRRLTTPDRLRAALAARSRVRWRAELSIALGDLSAGVHSPLERRYVLNVERAHGLPLAQRQAFVLIGGKRRYLDNLYAEAKLAVELDGLAAHPPEQRWADSRRDNEIAGLGILTLHYTWRDVDAASCLTAGQVGALLTARGTRVTLRKCGPACSVGGPVAPRLASESSCAGLAPSAVLGSGR